MAEYQPLQESAYRYIRGKVLAGQFQPNVLYSETKIASELHISRTPLKDALVRLNHEKLIDIIPSKGFRLHEMSRDDILQTYQARTAVEGFCAMQLALNRSTPEGRASLHAMVETVDSMDDVLRQESDEIKVIDSFIQYDLLFHQTLVDFSKNNELRQLFNAYHYRLYFFAREAFREKGRLQNAHAEHRKILESIRDESDSVGVRAYLAIMEHMEATRDIMFSAQSSMDTNGFSRISRE